MKKSNLILWGCGREGEKFLYGHMDIYDKIAFCIDNGYQEAYFHGIKVKTFDMIDDLSKCFVIIATVWDTFNKIKEILIGAGLKEFDDFSWVGAYEKKLVVFNTNCYMDTISSMLLNSMRFRNEYAIYPRPWIFLNKEKKIDDSLLTRADVFIYQNIRSDSYLGHELSNDYILPRLRKDCVKISIPNYNKIPSFIYPYLQDQIHYRIFPSGVFGGQYYGDSILDEAAEKGLVEFSDIYRWYCEYEYPEGFLDECYESFIKKIKEREKNWDIKLSNYVENNFRQIPLFADSFHPSHIAFKFITENIGRIIGLDDLCIPEPKPLFGAPLLKQIKEHFGLMYDYNEIVCPFLETTLSGTGEYIRYYLWQKYNMRV